MRFFSCLAAASLVFACAPAPAPAPAAPVVVTPGPETKEPAPEPEREIDTKPVPSEPTPEAITGVEACDRYLATYRKCEAKLVPEIQAGNRRSYEAEKNWLVFMNGREEKSELPASCASMQSELEKSCP